MIRKLFIVGLMLVFASAAFGARLTQKQLTFIDEFGDKISHTELTSVTILNAGTATESTIYNMDGSSMTNPIITGLAADMITFWSKDADYKCTATDGSYTRTVDNLTGSQTRFAFPTYLVAMASRTANDNQTFVWGSHSDVSSQWIEGSTAFRWTPLSDGVKFEIGSTAEAKQFNFHVYVGGIAGGGLEINEATGAFTYYSTSGAISFDETGSGTFGVHTGAATGAITLGSGTSGAWAIDGASTGTLNADGSIGITTTGGSADITVDATAGSVIIDGSETSVDDAVVIMVGADSGIRITSFADIDITTTGTAGEDITISNAGGSILIASTEDVTDSIDIDTQGGIDIDMGGGAADDFDVNTLSSIILTSKENVTGALLFTANSGTTATIKIHNDTGNADDSIGLLSDVGGITLTSTIGSIDIEAMVGGGEAGDIILNAGDDMTFTVAGDFTWAVTGTMSAGGSAITNLTRDVNSGMRYNYTLTAAESSGVFSVSGPATAAAVTLTLPTAVAGLQYTIIDANDNSDADVLIQGAAGDKINGATAAKIFGSHGADSMCSVTLVAVDADNWEIIAIFDPNDCWVNDDS